MLCQSFEGEALAGVMPGKQQRNAPGFGFEASVEVRFARDEELTVASESLLEKRARTAARDGDAFDFLVVFADKLKFADLQKPFQARGDICQRCRLGKTAITAAANVRHRFRDFQRLNVYQPEPFRQALIDPSRRRIERRMRTVDRHIRANESQQEPPDGHDGEYRPCAVCGATKRKLPVSMVCINGHTPEQMDRAAKAQRGW